MHIKKLEGVFMTLSLTISVSSSLRAQWHGLPLEWLHTMPHLQIFIFYEEQKRYFRTRIMFLVLVMGEVVRRDTYSCSRHPLFFVGCKSSTGSMLLPNVRSNAATDL
jgi:hypothetical protein